MKGERPINADEPAAEDAAKAGKAEGGQQPAEPAGAADATAGGDGSAAAAKDEDAAKTKDDAKTEAPERRRGRIPAALKLVAALVAIAIVFIVVALLGLGGEGGRDEAPAPTPVATPGATEETAEEPAEQAASELGYPGFATDNTTRIGGSDPASNAAAAALAVFPSVTAAQRPTAVSLVDAADWQAAIAAAVLMAEPLRAPVLIADADGLPGPTEEALAVLSPSGGRGSGGAGVFVVGNAPRPDVEAIKRIDGRGAAAAAAIAELRDQLFGGAPRHIVLAPSGQPGFAMPAAGWAARSGDPVLFADLDRLPKPTAAYLRSHPKAPVYVLGPSSAISSDTLREVAEISREVHRVSGEDPVANAIAFARYSNSSFGWNINDPGHGFVVARSDSPLDAAAAAPLSAAGTWGPLLLTDGAEALPPALRDYLLDVKPGYSEDPTRAFYNHVWVVGDQEAISVAQQAEINELAELAKIGAAGE